MKLTTRENAIAGERRAVVNRPCTQVDPNVALLASPDRREAAGEPRRLGISGGGSRGVGVGTRLLAEVEQVDVDGWGGSRAGEPSVIFSDEVVDNRVGHGGEGAGVEGRGRGIEVCADGGPGTGCELGRRSGGRDVEMDVVGQRKAVRAAAGEEVGRGDGGRDERREDARGGGREGGSAEADVDGDVGGKGEEARREDRGRGGERAAQAGGERAESVVAGRGVARGRRQEEGVEAGERGPGGGGGKREEEEG